MKKFLPSLLLVILCLIPVSAFPKVINAVAAVVNDDIITLYEVNHEALAAIQDAEKKSLLDTAARSALKRTVLERLVEKTLVEQKVKELNIRVGDEEINQTIEDVRKQNNMPNQEALVKALANQGITFDKYRGQLREQLEKLKLVSQEVRSKIHVGEAEMKEYYEANSVRYSEEETFHARHIFFHVNDKASAEEAKQTMSTALMALADAKGGKDFGELAKKYSEDPAAKKDGGDLGQFKKGDMLPELESVIMSMKPGEVSDLVRTPAGFHIIKLEERAKGKQKSFESVKAEIEDTLYKNKSEERFNQWAKELRSKASVEEKDLHELL